MPDTNRPLCRRGNPQRPKDRPYSHRLLCCPPCPPTTGNHLPNGCQQRIDHLRRLPPRCHHSIRSPTTPPIQILRHSHQPRPGIDPTRSRCAPLATLNRMSRVAPPRPRLCSMGARTHASWPTKGNRWFTQLCGGP